MKLIAFILGGLTWLFVLLFLLNKSNAAIAPHDYIDTRYKRAPIVVQDILLTPLVAPSPPNCGTTTCPLPRT